MQSLLLGLIKIMKEILFFKNGKPVETEEYVSEWSVKILKEMLYEGKFVLPIDYQFHKQLNSVISTLSGTRRIYACASTEDHLFCAFKVLAIFFFGLMNLILINIYKLKVFKGRRLKMITKEKIERY